MFNSTDQPLPTSTEEHMSDPSNPDHDSCIEDKPDLHRKASIYKTEQLNNQLEEFIDYFSHEIRNPLNGMCGGIFALNDLFRSLKSIYIENQLSTIIPPSLLQQMEENIAIINQCTEQQKIIVNNILTLSKLENNTMELNPSVFELKETITNTIKIFIPQIKQKNLQLILELPNNPLWLKADPYQLSQIIANLISNAIKFTDCGNIKFTAAIEPTFELFSEKVTINFVVQDTGIGISASKINNLFPQFIPVQNRTGTEYNGSGLGLSISKKIIELMGGTIQIDSEIDQGTKCSFHIKCNNLNEQELLEAIKVKHLQDNNSNIPPQIPKLKGKRILIVEDNEINTIILIGHLKQTGCFYNTAPNGISALEQYHQNRFDLILMDIEIPIINGLKVTKQIREKELLLDYHTPIIGISSYTSQAKINQALQSGMDDYLPKPYSPKDLFKLIREYIVLKDKEVSNVSQIQSETVLCTRFAEISTSQSSNFPTQSSSSDMLCAQIEKGQQKKLKKKVMNFTISSSTPSNFTSQSSSQKGHKIKCVIL
jgi:CheY-like chemotaxis protein